MADLAAFLRAHRDVLQVGVGRGEAAGRGTRHVIRGVHPVGLGIELAHQRVGVGALELGELAMLQDLHGQRMALRGEIVEHRGIRGPRAVLVALATRQLLLVEQDLAQLLGARDVEFAAGDLVQLDLERGQPLLELGAEALQFRGVDLDAGAFHAQQHGDQRPLDGLVHGDHVLGRDARLELRPELHGDVGVFGGVLQRLVERHLVEAHLLGAAAGHVGELDGLLVEVALGQLVHAMAVLAAVEHEGEQHRVVDRADLDAVALQHGDVVLDVLADLQHARVLEQRLQLLDRLLERNLARQQLAVAAGTIAAQVERALCFAARRAMGQRQVGGAALARIDVAPRAVKQGEGNTD